MNINTKETLEKSIKMFNELGRTNYSTIYDVLGMAPSDNLVDLQNKCRKEYELLRENTTEIAVVKKDIIGGIGYKIFDNAQSKNDYDLSINSSMSGSPNIGVSPKKRGYKKISLILILLISIFTIFWLFAKSEDVPTNKAIKAQFSNTPTSSKKDIEYIDELIKNYTKAWATAVNKNDFSIVSPYLIKGSNLYNAQKELIPYYAKNKIKEEFIDYSVVNYKSLDKNNTFEVNVYEEYIIYINDKKQNKGFNWVYTVKSDPNWGLTDIKKDIKYTGKVNPVYKSK